MKKVKLAEIKFSTIALEQGPKEFRFMNTLDSIPIHQSGNHLVPFEDFFEVNTRAAKKFYVDGKEVYIVWSPEVEEFLEMPLGRIDELISENYSLGSRLNKSERENEDLNRFICALEQANDDTRTEVVELEENLASSKLISWWLLGGLLLTGAIYVLGL